MKIFLTKHSYQIIRTILTLLVLFPIFSCSAKTNLILLNIDDTKKEFWNEIIISYPLPDNFQFILENTDNRVIPELKLILSKNALNLDSKILLEKQYLVPGTDFFNSITDISINDISNYQLISMEEIELPLKGLSIDGLYPGDPGYPVFINTLLSLSFPEDYTDNNNSNTELLKWFEELKLNYDQSNKPLQKIIWIAGVGDIMVQRGVETILMNRSNGAEYIFGNTLEVLQNQDIMLGNLEGSITYSNTKTPKSYNFKFNPDVLPILKESGFDYFSLTNNHIYDYGERGFTDTLKYLKEAELPTSGAGLSKLEATEYTEMFIDGNSIRILSMGAYPQERNGWNGRTMAQVSDTRPGILFDGELALEAVKNMASPSGFDILMIHGGVEWTSIPEESQRLLYKSYLDAGVDIILGSHPHVLQGMEEWQGKLIAYSLGNFIFPGMGSMKFAEESMILSVGIYNNQIKFIKTIPVNIDNQRISIDNSGIILERFENLSKEIVRSK